LADVEVKAKAALYWQICSLNFHAVGEASVKSCFSAGGGSLKASSTT